MRPPTKHWSTEDLAIAAALRNEGASHDAIAARIGRSAASVTGRLARLRATGQHVMVANEITKWTPERDDQAIALWNQGMSTVGICARLGTTRKAILARIVVLRRSKEDVRTRRMKNKFPIESHILIALQRHHPDAPMEVAHEETRYRMGVKALRMTKAGRTQVEIAAMLDLGEPTITNLIEAASKDRDEGKTSPLALWQAQRHPTPKKVAEIPIIPAHEPHV